MPSRQFTIREYGFKINPFSKDRIDPDTFRDENFDKLMCENTEIKRILNNEENFQLITGFPGTGKSITLLTLQHKINSRFDGKFAIYLGDVSLLLASKDLLDENKHMSDISNNIICKIWATYIQVLEEQNRNDLIKKLKHARFWARFKNGVAVFLSNTLRFSIKKKLGIDLSQPSKIDNSDTSLLDIIEAVREIKELSQNSIKKIFLLFDELGEYTKKFNLRLKETDSNTRIPYFYEYLVQLKDQEGIIIKVAGYPDAVKYFSDAGLEDQHMHWESLDPRFSKKSEFDRKMTEFFQLTTAMFLKRVTYYHIDEDPQNKKGEYYFNLIAGGGYMMFKDATVIQRICTFSNFNPRLALNIASEAFMIACTNERNDFAFNSKDLQDYTSLKGEILPYDYIKQAVSTDTNSRALAADNVLKKYKFGHKFFNKLAEKGANYFTLPHIETSVKENADLIEHFNKFFESLKKKRLILQYPTFIRIGSESRDILAIDMSFFYHWISTFISTPDLNKYKSYLGFNKLYKNFIELKSQYKIPEYFIRYDFNEQDLLDLFIIGEEMQDIESRLVELEEEKNKIDQKLINEELSENQEGVLEGRLREIRNEIKQVSLKLKKIQKGEEYIDEKISEPESNLYGQMLEEEEAIFQSDDEVERYMKFFEGYPNKVEEMGKILYEYLKSLKKDDITPEFSIVKSYIKIFDVRDNCWAIILNKLMSGINIHFFTPDNDERQLYNVFPHLQSDEIDWEWSYTYNESGMLWIKIRSIDQIKDHPEEFKKLIYCSFQQNWTY